MPHAEDRESGGSDPVLADIAATPTVIPRMHGSGRRRECSGARAGPQVATSQDAACRRTHPHSSGGNGLYRLLLPFPAPWRRATKQPLGPPTAHPPAQPEPEVSTRRARGEPAKLSLEEEAEHEGPCLTGDRKEKEELRGGSRLLVEEAREDPCLLVVREAREGLTEAQFSPGW